MLEPNQSNSKTKRYVEIFAGAIAIVLLLTAILSRKTDPHSSSFAFVSALLMLFGITANFVAPKIQSFLYRRGYKPDTIYMNASGMGDSHGSGSSMDSGISCNFGDGGGCDGGG